MSRRLTTEEFIRRAKEIHKDENGNPLYDYLLVNYKNNKTKVKIRCLVCGNIFEQTPDSHLRGSGCRLCAIKRVACKQRLSKEEFLQRLFKRFPERQKADFSKFEYINSMTKSIVICENGHEFQTRPNALMSGYWCPYCAGKLKMTKEEFIKKAIKIHKDEQGNPLYDYSLIEYKNNHTKLKIICKRCNTVFECTPNNHLSKKSGCPHCSKTGIDLNKPVVLYYVKIVKDGKVFYKIGITNSSVRSRFICDELDDLKVLKTWYFENGYQAYKLEQKILNKFRNFRYKKKDILRTGNTELFVTNLLNEITKEVELCQ